MKRLGFSERGNKGHVYMPIRYLNELDKPLTICIAAIAEANSDVPKIVFCADRMISAGLQFQHGVAKIKRLTDSCFVMMASGDSLTSDMILRDTQDAIRGEQNDVEEIVDELSGVCLSYKQKRRERDVLVPLGYSYKFLKEQPEKIPREMMRTISDLLLDYHYDFRTEFLVFGIDDLRTPHIYLVNQDGDYKLHDFLGFAVTGSGSDTAFPELTKYLWHPAVTMSEAIARIYNAKKAAERVGGVGTFTDLYVLHVLVNENKERTVALWETTTNKPIMELLETRWNDLKKAEDNAYQKMVMGVVEELQKAIAKVEPAKEETKEVTRT